MMLSDEKLFEELPGTCPDYYREGMRADAI